MSSQGKAKFSIFSPVIKLSDSMGFKYKFILWSVLFLIPIVYGSYALLSDFYQDLRATRQEQHGYQLISGLPAVNLAIGQHQHLQAQLLLRKEISQQQLSQSLQIAEQQVQRLQGQLPAKLNKELNALKAGLAELGSDKGRLGAKLDRHEAAAGQLRALMNAIAVEYAVLRDPEVSAYFLVDISIKRLPILVSQLARLRDRAADVADFGILDAESISDMSYRIDSSTEILRDMQKSVAQLYAVAPEYQLSFGAKLEQAMEQMQGMITTLNEQILKDQQVKTTTELVVEQGNAAMLSLQAAQQASLTAFGEA